VGGRPVSLSDLDTPSYCVGTVTDHVAPWRSVHKLHYLTSVELRFVLTSGGHNAGIVSPPGQPRRHFQALDRPAGENYIAPDEWLALAPATRAPGGRTGRPGWRPTRAPRWRRHPWAPPATRRWAMHPAPMCSKNNLAAAN
jgi:hypothetical protein